MNDGSDDELPAMVGASMGPASVDDVLREAMDALRAEYPSASLQSASLTFTVTRRSGGPVRYEMDWRVQAENETGRGRSCTEALKELRDDWEEAKVVPEMASRVAEVLRSMPANAPFGHERVLMRAREILEREKYNR